MYSATFKDVRITSGQVRWYTINDLVLSKLKDAGIRGRNPGDSTELKLAVHYGDKQ